MKKFLLTHLYPREMCIYGDMGNIRTIEYKLSELGFEVVYQPVNPGDQLPEQSDFYFIGGGQDQEQYEIFKDLLNKRQKLIEEIELGVGLLSICGGYQLLGKSFLTGDGRQIDGIGLFQVETKAPDESVKSRCIGNLVVDCWLEGLENVKLVGFENHGGQTYFINGQTSCKPLGKVLAGFGNNNFDGEEGCVYKNAVGTYLHGSCLPKNPGFTNYLITESLKAKSGRESQNYLDNSDFEIFDDTISKEVNQSLVKRFTD